MLVHQGTQGDISGDINSIHNYYEHLVLDRITAIVKLRDLDASLTADIACVALNRLPPRYIRYDVDMAFYLSPNEYDEIEQKVYDAVDDAILFVQDRGKRHA